MKCNNQIGMKKSLKIKSSIDFPFLQENIVWHRKKSRFQRIIRVKTIKERIEQQEMIFRSMLKHSFLTRIFRDISKYPCAFSDNPLIQGKFALS